MTEDVRLMFMTRKYFEQGKAVRGGSLVTDDKTRPVEFRCTSPIRPNAYQQLFYGDTLDSYIFVDLIGVPLITGTREAVEVIFVDDRRFLPARPHVDVPIVLLTRPGDNKRTSLVSLDAYTDFESEKQVIQSRFASLLETRDLLEPFERVHLALDQAHIQKIGDKGA